MPSRYIFLKCVPAEAAMWEQPSRILRITELKQLVEADSELIWGVDPHGTIPIQNPDGTVVMMPPHQGFSFTKAADSAFYICYEFYSGLAIHSENNERVHERVLRFAEELSAKVFLM